MKYYFMEPEVAGGLGRNTIMDRSTHPPIVSKLHYEFDGWLGDVILESFPSYIVTDEARLNLQAVGATGAAFGAVEITVSESLRERQPGLKLPAFVWLQVTGAVPIEE